MAVLAIPSGADAGQLASARGSADPTWGTREVSIDDPSGDTLVVHRR